MFDGVKVPNAVTSLTDPEHINEVTLNALIKDMSELELDFLRSCLVIDGQQRPSVDQLLEHPFFDKEFTE
jgi:serine/threonine protein kinase